MNKEARITIEVLLQMKYGFKLINNYKKLEICDLCKGSTHTDLVFELPCTHVCHYDCLFIMIESRYFKCPSCSQFYYKSEHSNNTTDLTKSIKPPIATESTTTYIEEFGEAPIYL